MAAGSIGVCLCFESEILAGFYLPSTSLLQLLLMLVELWDELNVQSRAGCGTVSVLLEQADVRVPSSPRHDLLCT